MGLDRPRFGVVGHGRFGALVVRHLSHYGATCVHDVAWGPTTPHLPEGARRATLEVTASARSLVLAVPMRGLEATLVSVAPLVLPGTLVADVASVKVRPMEWLRSHLPENVDFVGTHPLFGPDSAPHDLHGQKIVLVPGRIGSHRRERLRRFLERMGLRVIEATAEEHDRAMARTQALTHWLGRAFHDSGAQAEQLDTLGHRLLLEVARFVGRDSWELFSDMQRYNPYAAELRLRFREAMDALDARLDQEPDR